MRIELDLYSGRPNPGWSLTPAEAAELTKRLAELLATPAVGEPPEPLGYRGLRIVGSAGGRASTASGDGETASIGGGVVTLTDDRGRVERRSDAGRSLECWLLQTARGRLDETLLQIALAGPGPACE